MTGQHYRKAERWLDHAVELDGELDLDMVDPVEAGQLAAVIGRGYAALANTAALAELNASGNMARDVEAANAWNLVLDDQGTTGQP